MKLRYQLVARRVCDQACQSLRIFVHEFDSESAILSEAEEVTSSGRLKSMAERNARRHSTTCVHTHTGTHLPVFCSKGAVTLLPVLVRKHFKDGCTTRHEEEQNGLKSMRRYQHIGLSKSRRNLTRVKLLLCVCTCVSSCM